MNADELFDAFASVRIKIIEKAQLARRVAKDAHKKGNATKHAKFNSVARVYEMIFEDLDPISAELFANTSDEFKASDIPF